MVNGEIDKDPPSFARELDSTVSDPYSAPLWHRPVTGTPSGLPPQNLNTRDAAAPCDYHVYKLTKPFWVGEGSIAPWFERPGGGRQIKLDPVFLNPSEGQRLNVKWLLEHGYLAAVQP